MLENIVPVPSLYAKLTSCSWSLNVSRSVKSIFSFSSWQDRPKCLTVPNACCRALSCVNLGFFSSLYSPVQNFPRSSLCLLSHLFVFYLSIISHSVCFHRLLTVRPSSFLTTFSSFSPVLIYPFHSLALQPFPSRSSSITAPFSTLLSPFVPLPMTSFWLHVTRSFDISYLSSSPSSAPSDQDAQEEGEKSKECDFFFCSRNKTSPLLKPDTLSPNLPMISTLKMNHPLPKFHCTHISEGNSAQMR